MALIPFAVLWLAYQCGWYGFTTIKPICGVGFTDLLLPNKMSKVDGLIQNPQPCSGAQQPQPNTLPNNPTCPPGGARTSDGTCVPGTLT